MYYKSNSTSTKEQMSSSSSSKLPRCRTFVIILVSALSITLLVVYMMKEMNYVQLSDSRPVPPSSAPQIQQKQSPSSSNHRNGGAGSRHQSTPQQQQQKSSSGNNNNNNKNQPPPETPPPQQQPPKMPEPLGNRAKGVERTSAVNKAAGNLQHNRPRSPGYQRASAYHHQRPPPPSPPMDQEQKAAHHLRQPSEPVRCRKDRKLMHESQALLRKYGTIEDGAWCEMITEPVPHLSGVKRETFDFRSAELFEPEALMKQKQQQNNSNIVQSPLPNLPGRVEAGSTYFDYRASADGNNWPYYQCPIHHKIKCNTKKLKQREANGVGKKLIKSRALVVFVVSSAQAPLQHHVESSNLLFFLKNGLIPAKKATALYDEVDFVFAKIQLAGEKTENRFVDCGDFEEAKLIREKILEHQQKRQPTETPSNNSSSDAESQQHQHHQHDHHHGLPSNIRFLMVPKVNCDVCAHARILDHLGVFSWKNETARLNECSKHGRIQNMDSLFGNPRYDNTQRIDPKNSYSQIIMLNSGARGPFFVNEDDLDHVQENKKKKNNKNNNKNENENDDDPPTTWVDYVSMGGRPKIPNPRLGFFHHPIARKKTDTRPTIKKSLSWLSSNLGVGGADDASSEEDETDECPIHMASAVSISWEQKMHMQTYFVAAPIELVRARLYALFGNTCGGDKVYCIVKGEVESSRTVIDFSTITGVYSMGRQFHIRDTGHEARVKGNDYFLPPRNPCYTWNDPCKAVFVKNAGHLVSDNKHFLKTMGGAIDRLTKGMTVKKLGEMNSAFDYSDMLGIRKMFNEKNCEWDF